MPYLRFTRDPRGYENTSIVHAVRRGGGSRSKILYWFRSPPNVKVGRAPLDEEAIREIEKRHPDLVFDWTRILEAQPAPAPEPPQRGERRGRRRGGRGSAAQARSGESARSRGVQAGRAEAVEPEAIAPDPIESEASASPAIDTDAADVPEVEAVTPAVEMEATGHLLDHDETLAERLAESEDEEDEDEEGIEAAGAQGAVESLVGPEGLARLRARFAELQARITERGGDPIRAADLRARAEVLNPDTWVTIEEARGALEQYELRLDELRRLLGTRRRRSRRGGRRRRGRSGQSQPGPVEGAGAAPDEQEGSDEGPQGEGQ